MCLFYCSEKLRQTPNVRATEALQAVAMRTALLAFATRGLAIHGYRLQQALAVCQIENIGNYAPINSPRRSGDCSYSGLASYAAVSRFGMTLTFA
jgi:hypothetical protein